VAKLFYMKTLLFAILMLASCAGYSQAWDITGVLNEAKDDWDYVPGAIVNRGGVIVVAIGKAKISFKIRTETEGYSDAMQEYIHTYICDNMADGEKVIVIIGETACILGDTSGDVEFVFRIRKS